mgnify:CR=1 FL=1
MEGAAAIGAAVDGIVDAARDRCRAVLAAATPADAAARKSAYAAALRGDLVAARAALAPLWGGTTS